MSLINRPNAPTILTLAEPYYKENPLKPFFKHSGTPETNNRTVPGVAGNRTIPTSGTIRTVP